MSLKISNWLSSLAHGPESDKSASTFLKLSFYIVKSVKEIFFNIFIALKSKWVPLLTVITMILFDTFYGWEISAARLIFDYLTSGKQETKTGCLYSSERHIRDCHKQLR